MIESDIKINVLVEPSLKFDFVGFFSDGMALVRKDDDKFGFVDKTGEVIIAVIYDEPIYFSDGLARVKIDDKYGLINKSGEVVVPFDYDWMGDYYGQYKFGLTRAVKDDKMGFLDLNGNVAVPFIYDLLFDFNGELAFVWKNGKEEGCYINKNGTEVTPYEYIGDQWRWWVYEPTHEGLTIAFKNDKFGCGSFRKWLKIMISGQ